jgi:hypothetical protein
VTLDCVSKDRVRRFCLPNLKSKTKTPIRLANGQSVTCSIVCEISPFDQARQEFKRIFNVLRDLRVDDLVLGLSWVDDEQASLQLGTTRVFTMMNGKAVET